MFLKQFSLDLNNSSKIKEEIKHFFIKNFGDSVEQYRGKPLIRVYEDFPSSNETIQGVIADIKIKQGKGFKTYYVYLDVDLVIFLEISKKNNLRRQIKFGLVHYILSREEQVIFPQFKKYLGEDARIVMHRNNPRLGNILNGVLLEVSIKDKNNKIKLYYLELGGNKKLSPEDYKEIIRKIELPVDLTFGTIFYKIR